MASPSSMATRPIGNRKLDILYIVFLSAVAFFPLILDFVPFYPIELPSWAKTPYNFYSTQYNDPLFMNHPPFFQLYVFIEAFYLVPMALYGINGLLNETTMAPVHLLVLSTHLISSTLVCLVEVMYAKDVPQATINKNLPGYVSFLVVGFVMWFDMFGRVKLAINSKVKTV